VEDKMYLVQLPFVPAGKAEYDINDLEANESIILTLYPEIARCVSCNTCTKSCPQDVEVMKYIQMAIRGDIARCAEISFDCIQCGLCAMRCPADIKHYHVSQLARRLYGKYLTEKSMNLERRVKEIEEGKWEEELDRLVKMPEKDIVRLYKEREIEAEEV
jgi:heterodisulfide reductase subunit C